MHFQIAGPTPIRVLQQLINFATGGLVGHLFTSSVIGPSGSSEMFRRAINRSYSSTEMTMTTPRPCFSISSGSARAASIISEKPEVMVNERQKNSRRHG
jgi:hypothetical protein